MWDKYYIEDCRIVAMDRYRQVNISLLKKVYVYICCLIFNFEILSVLPRYV